MARTCERRRAYFIELYHTGRWKRYYSEEQFLLKLREAIKASDRWAEIAPTQLQIYDRDAARPQISAAA